MAKVTILLLMSDDNNQNNEKMLENTGSEIIKGYVRNLPDRPGVYRMINKHSDVIYVGKAKNLKNRVTSYTRLNGHTNRIQRMISETRLMEFIETHTEKEALLLEANLIKRYQPAYNVLLKDNKMYPYIMITGDHDFPLLTKHRGSQKKEHKYFGPFASADSVNRTLIALQKAFLLRNCSDNIFANRSRPCLQYQIKRCTAPCVGLVTQDEYKEQVEQAKDFFSGKNRVVQDSLTKKMLKASADLEFEKAAHLRDRIKALTNIQSDQGINLPSLGDVDVMALAQEAGKTCIQVFFFRQGRNYGNRAFFPSHEKDLESPYILSQFIVQFYDNKPVPNTLILSHKPDESELIEEALSKKAERKVRLLIPSRGDKKKVLDHALNNAKQALIRNLNEHSNQQKLLESLIEIFDLSDIPQRIEVYDNSHISGTNQIGAMIVAGPDGFKKSQYRKFNIKGDIEAGDDYAMMREVFERRFARALKEDPSREKGLWPDLIFVDGGKGQLSSAVQTLNELGINDIPIYGISKGPKRNAGDETFHHIDGSSFKLPKNHPSLFFVQKLRDESHRFAIGTHRAKRKKETFKNPLDEIAGIGAKRKKALLLHFGSAKAVARAGLNDLCRVEGISEATAKVIYNHFNS